MLIVRGEELNSELEPLAVCELRDLNGCLLRQFLMKTCVECQKKIFEYVKTIHHQLLTSYFPLTTRLDVYVS